MELNSIVVHDVSDINILHPITGVETDIVISVFRPDSKPYKKVIYGLRNERMESRARVLSAEQLAEREVRMYARLTCGWKNIVVESEEIKFSHDAAFELYSNPKYSWLYVQVQDALENQLNFLSKAPTN